MPALRFHNGLRVEWGPRRDSRVLVAGRLEFFDTSYDILLDLPRQCWADRSRLMTTLTGLGAALVKYAMRRKRTGKKPVRVTCRVELDEAKHPLQARLTLPLRQLRPLQDTLRGLPNADAGAPSVIAQMIFGQFRLADLADLIVTSPRGQGVLSRYLTRWLPSAFLAAGTLVNMAGANDASTSASLTSIVENDEEVTAYLRVAVAQEWNVEHATIVALVDRGFRGAWEGAGHPGVMYRSDRSLLGSGPPDPTRRYRNPTGVLRKYHYGRNQRLSAHLKSMKTDDPRMYWSLLLDWDEKFLGAPGEAARSLGILK